MTCTIRLWQHRTSSGRLGLMAKAAKKTAISSEASAQEGFTKGASWSSWVMAEMLTQMAGIDALGRNPALVSVVQCILKALGFI